MSSPASVNVVRLVYLLVCQGAGVAIALSTKGTPIAFPLWVGLMGGLVVGAFFIWVESLVREFSIRGFSTATFGLLVGIFCAWLITRVDVTTLLSMALRDRLMAHDGTEEVAAESAINTLGFAVQVSLYAGFGFLGAVLALRSSREDFAFILPYIRFRQESGGGQPLVLDIDSVMDGRVLALVKSGFLSGRLVVPKFVLDEVQLRAGSGNGVRRQQAERGLEMLDKLKGEAGIEVTIDGARDTAKEETVHGRLLQVSRLLGAKLMTADEQLAKVARLRGVEVLNLEELLEALKPRIAVGERLRLALVRNGKEEHQAVGYLADGTMIVVNHAASRIGSTEEVVVGSLLQTAAGQLVFAELAAAGGAATQKRLADAS